MIPVKTEVLVVGGGHAGVCAAISAREAGSDVVLLESAPEHMRGGNTRHTRNLRAMHEQPVHTLPGSYTAEEYWEDILRVTGGHTNEHLAQLMIRDSRPLMDWLHERGVRYQPALSGTLSLDRTNAFFLGGGKAMLNAEYQEAERLGVRVYYDTEVQGLDILDGSFRSATVSCGGTTSDLTANAVVLASGGFQSNEEWMREIWGSAADNFLVRGTPYNRGSILKCLMESGAETVGDPTQCHAVAIDARGPRYDGGIVTRVDCVCFGVVVNKHGQRFYDEGEDFWPKRYAIWGRLVAQQPDQIAYAVVDSKVMDQFMPSLYPALTADSIEALADQVEINTHNLKQTLEEFNAAVRPGEYDPKALDSCRTKGLTPPKSHWALPINKPPFACYPLRPGITFTYLAARVDEQARVLFRSNGASENVFAAGEIMAGNIVGQGYCAGSGMTIGGVFGRIAGSNAAMCS